MNSSSLVSIVLFCLIAQIINAQDPYCIAKSISPHNVWVEKIYSSEKVIITGDDGSYGYHNSKINLLVDGCNHTIFHFNDKTRKAYAVWIDWNQDSVFDSDERILGGFGTHGVRSTNIIVPEDAVEGITRMRIVTVKHPDTYEVCGYLDSGEVEDHTVVIQSDDYYCSNFGQSTYYEWIEKLHLNSQNIVTGNNEGYLNATCGYFWPSVYNNQSYNLICYPGFSGAQFDERWKVFIDWNQDEDFNDLGEMIIDTITDWKFYAPFTVPSDVQGMVRMRVSMGYPYTTYNAPCGEIAYGEVEDYRLFVRPSSSSMTSNEVVKAVQDQSLLHNKNPITSPQYKISSWVKDLTITATFLDENPTNGSILLFDISGKLLEKQKVDFNPEFKFNVEHSGIYILVFQNESLF